MAMGSMGSTSRRAEASWSAETWSASPRKPSNGVDGPGMAADRVTTGVTDDPAERKAWSDSS